MGPSRQAAGRLLPCSGAPTLGHICPPTHLPPLPTLPSHPTLPRSCLYNYIQAPLEGPGTANLELLDD